MPKRTPVHRPPRSTHAVSPQHPRSHPETPLQAHCLMNAATLQSCERFTVCTTHQIRQGHYEPSNAPSNAGTPHGAPQSPRLCQDCTPHAPPDGAPDGAPHGAPPLPGLPPHTAPDAAPHAAPDAPPDAPPDAAPYLPRRDQAATVDLHRGTHRMSWAGFPRVQRRNHGFRQRGG